MTTIRPTYLPAPADIRQAFAEEVESLGGRVTHAYEDHDRFFARAMLSSDAEIRPGDRVRGGVAVRAGGVSLDVFPYTFRQVCSNGAIAAQALEGRRLERVEGLEVAAPSYDVAVVRTDLRLAVRACASPEAFATTTGQMRAATETEADFTLNLLPFLSQLPAGMAQHWLPRILHRFTRDGDRSTFGMMNAVTSLARDVRDEETRWRLEELGGSLPALLLPRPRIAPPAAELAHA
jgi:hypothetical protein